MGRRFAFVVLVGLITAVLAHPRASAQPAGEDIEMEPEPEGSAAGSGSGSAAVVKDPKVAKKWLAAAKQLAQKGDYFARASKPDDAKAQYENAITAYQNAVDAGDDINVYFELATVEDKLGKSDVAAKHFRLIVNAKTGAKPDLQKKAAAKLDDLSTKVGMVTLTVKPEGATVSLGGAEIGHSPLPEPLVLMPGTYTVSFAAEGFQPKDSEIKVEAGSESERTIELEPIKIVIEKPHAGPETPDAGPVVATPPSKLPLYVSGGIAAASLTTAVITGLLAVGQHSTYVAKDSTKIERQDARDNGKRLAVISDVTLGIAVVAGGIAAYWYFVKSKESKSKAEHETRAPELTKVDVVPWVQPSAGGVSLGGSF